MTTPPGAVRRLPGTAPAAELHSATPGHVAWPHHDPGAGIPAQPVPARGVPPVRWPQGSLEWLIAIASVPADPVSLPPAGTGGLVESGQLILFGASLLNAGTVAGHVNLFDGMDAKGTLIVQLDIAAGASANLNIPRAGILCEIGLFAVVTAGTITGPTYVGHVWKYPFTPPGE